MTDQIRGLADLRPGDIMFAPIGGLVPGVFPVGLGQLALGEVFRVGRLSVRHVGIVVEASEHLPPGSSQNLRTKQWHAGSLLPEAMPFGGEFQNYPTGVITAPRLVQAMPGGAEEIELRIGTHWTPRHAYLRLPEDYPGQAENAALLAREMIGTPYSFASYAALAAYRFGIRSGHLERWINRRRAPTFMNRHNTATPGWGIKYALPREAICSVLVDQAWTLAGKDVMPNTAEQAVTPGALANQLWRTPGAIWGLP